MDKNRFMELLTKDLAGEITADELRELIYLRGEPYYNKKEEELLRAFWTNRRQSGYDSSSLIKKVRQKITLSLILVHPFINSENNISNETIT